MSFISCIQELGAHFNFQVPHRPSGSFLRPGRAYDNVVTKVSDNFNQVPVETSYEICYITYKQVSGGTGSTHWQAHRGHRAEAPGGTQAAQYSSLARGRVAARRPGHWQQWQAAIVQPNYASLITSDK